MSAMTRNELNQLRLDVETLQELMAEAIDIMMSCNRGSDEWILAKQHYKSLEELGDKILEDA